MEECCLEFRKKLRQALGGSEVLPVIRNVQLKW